MYAPLQKPSRTAAFHRRATVSSWLSAFFHLCIALTFLLSWSSYYSPFVSVRNDLWCAKQKISCTYEGGGEQHVFVAQRWDHLTFTGPCILIYFYSKTNQMHQCIKFILFWNDTLHVSDGLSVHHQELTTVHTATDICQTDTAVCLLAGTRCSGGNM